MARPQRVAVIGYGVEGKSAFKYWKAKGADVTIRNDTELPELVPGATIVTGSDYLDNLDQYDLVVRSPGVRPWLINTTAEKSSVVKEFLTQCPARVIGVTGTKGKGTTSSLIARILGEAAWRTWVGGNIGQSPLDFLPKVRANHIVILELSSFQLMDLDSSPHIAVCLMVVPEHLDWHRNQREYVAAKGNIFWHQRPEDLAVYDGLNDFSTQIGQLSPGRKLPYLEQPGAVVREGRISIEGVEICKTDEVGLIGPHNLENICAAVTATWDLVGKNPDPVRRGVTAFTGLEYRLEHVRTVGRVDYYNDSFSTTPETAIAAIRSFPGPKVMIMGGSDKKSQYEGLARAVKDGNVRYAMLIGEMGPSIKSALDSVGFTKTLMGPRRMSEIVSSVRAVAEPGDVVLLSPACASLDMFASYKDRGDQFSAAVRALA